MARKLLTLGVSPEIIKKAGLGESVALWEDGQRCDSGPGFFEWWYFDAHLDDGTTAVVVFPPSRSPGTIARSSRGCAW